jgi:hypothetical protein
MFAKVRMTQLLRKGIFHRREEKQDVRRLGHTLLMLRGRFKSLKLWNMALAR